jgi:hypothetical protein
LYRIKKSQRKGGLRGYDDPYTEFHGNSSDLRIQLHGPARSRYTHDDSVTILKYGGKEGKIVSVFQHSAKNS